MIQVTAAIIRYNDTVLLARRAANQSHAGKWEFPGGKTELGETPEECLVREIREEFQISATIDSFFCESIYTYPKGQIQLLAYEVQVSEDPWRLIAHDKIAWVKKDQLLKYDLLPADIPIAKKLAL